LARNFRIVPKKRGNRSTGSKLWGRVIEASLSAVALLTGCVGLVIVLSRVVVPEWRTNHQFIEHRCVALDARLGRQETDDGTLFRPEIRIQYTVDGEKYVVWTYSIDKQYSSNRAAVQEILENYPAGHEYTCWYDPADPSVAVLVRSYSWSWLALAMPGSFILIGGGGLLHVVMTWGKSAERRAAQTKRAVPSDLLDAGRAGSDYPYVPPPASVTNSPGTTLSYRLPIVAASGWKLFAALVACLGWNGIVAVFACVAISGFFEGRPDWVLTLCVIPFAGVGMAIIVYSFRCLLLASSVGPTLVEISEQPLYPGKRCEAFVSQTGRMKMNSLEVLLVCDEDATFHQGTNTRRESLRVIEEPVYQRGEFDLRHGVPFEARFPIVVPAGTMHSFKSAHNEIRWQILVKGDVAGRPGFARSFPVIVCPAANGSNGRTNGKVS
jgi:hypothetical protein